MRTEPVKYWADPLLEGCEPLRVMVIVCESSFDTDGRAPDPVEADASFAWAGAEASRKSDIAVAVSSFIFSLFDSMTSG